MFDEFLRTLKSVHPNTIYSPDLESMLGISDSEVRDITRKLRRDGVMICSGDKGYSYTEDWRIYLKTIRILENKRNSLDVTIQFGHECIRKVRENEWKKKHGIEIEQKELTLFHE